MKASITVTGGPCIAYWTSTKRCESDEISCVIQSTAGRNCWPPAPNQLWSWDITKLRGPEKLCYYYLYVMLDVFSRYVVGWMVAEQESAALAGELITAACTNQGVEEDQLTIHADRGGPMIAKPIALLDERSGGHQEP